MLRLFRLAIFAVSVTAFAQPSKPILILVSFDGFRADYFDRVPTPNLHALAERGVRARALISAFPTKTFTNHYTIVTGLLPAHHGIISNTMYDPEWDAQYSRTKPSVKEGRWYGGEPIWETAEAQGLIAASYSWPGSEAPVNGKLQSYWKPYENNFLSTQRVDTVLAWLDLPSAKRPTCVTLYVEHLDEVGHDYGPDAPQTFAAVQHVDSLAGRLRAGIRKRNLEASANLMFVSDHGMTQLSPDRLIYVNEILDSAEARVVDWSPALALIPAPGKEEMVYEKLKKASAHWQVYRKNEIPERYRYRENRRITPLLAVADDGWFAVASRRQVQNRKFLFGNHGYDPELVSMYGLFVGSGPAFKNGLVVDRLENIHLYELMCKILGLKPAKNDGDFEMVKGMLK
jgi:predicted AlkP superfamily pyrophosphatase or phosphodiesterase